MKKIIVILVTLLMICSMVPFISAQDENDSPVVEDPTGEEPEVEIPEEIEEEAGVTPDSVFWGLERAIERIDLALTFNKAEKAKKGLAHAKERLMEVQVMIAEKKLTQAQKAQEEHDEDIEEAQENIAEIEEEGDEDELEDLVEIEKEIKEHAALVERVNELKLKTKNLSAEQQLQIRNMVNSMNQTAEKMQIEVMQKKDSVKVKIKAEKGMSDEEIEALEEEIKSVSGEDSEVKIIGKGKTKDKDKDDNETEDESEDGEEDDSDNDDLDEEGSDDKDKNKGKGSGKEKGDPEEDDEDSDESDDEDEDESEDDEEDDS
ncbi:DUF5667 domain-containing protein [Nanoarchaeota archaeon]